MVLSVCGQRFVRKLDLNIYRDGSEYEIKFKDGNSIKPLKKLQKQKKEQK